MMGPSIGAERDCVPFISLFHHNDFLLQVVVLPNGGQFLSNSASLYVFFFFISVFCSLLINTRLVFISYFVSVPLRKGHTDLEYHCSFVRLYLFLFAFLIICIETFGFS